MRAAAADPLVPTVLRVDLAPGLEASLVHRQLAWACLQAVGTLLAVSTLDAYPDAGFALALALGVLGAFPRQLPRGIVAACGVCAVTILAGVPGDGSSTASLWTSPARAAGWSSRGLAAPQILAGGAAAGIGLAWLHGPRSRHRLLHCALGGAATTGLGVWAASVLVPGSLHPALVHLCEGAVAGLVSSQVLAITALRLRSVQRPPGPRRVRARLHEAYRPPCLRAHALDAQLAERCPDQETRDGLGEIAAWVFALQWNLQRLDRELTDLDETALHSRIQGLETDARQSEDAFTADRMRATAEHLERLLLHVRELREERARNAALSDYASAYLEEARAGLALAQLHPGDHTPRGLRDVLSRLRSHGADRDARRRTAREVDVVG